LWNRSFAKENHMKSITLGAALLAAALILPGSAGAAGPGPAQVLAPDPQPPALELAHGYKRYYGAPYRPYHYWPRYRNPYVAPRYYYPPPYYPRPYARPYYPRAYYPKPYYGQPYYPPPYYPYRY
jgi:hypothetical protein